ncbi:hypothetical protein ACSSS7_001524 [Eimeria intestinalis]
MQKDESVRVTKPTSGHDSPQRTITPCESVELGDLEIAGSKGNQLEVDDAFPTCSESWLIRSTFFLLGWCSLFAWNNILYMLPYITEQFLDGWDAGNSLLGVFQVGNLSVQLFLLAFGSVYERWFYISLPLGSVLSGALAVVVTYGSVRLRIALLHVLCLLFGGCSGFLNGSGFSFAALMPDNEVGVFSTAQGFGSVFSVVLIGILSFTVFNLEVRKDVANLLFILCALTIALQLLTMLLIAVTMRRRVVKAAMAQARALLATDDTSETSSGSAGAAAGTTKSAPTKTGLAAVYEAWKQGAAPIVSIFIIFFVTCNLFPRVGPLQWDTANPPKNHLVWLLGVFPFGDTLGRCFCILADRVAWFKRIIFFPPKLLPWVCVLRFILYVPFFLSKHLGDNVVLSAFWFQMLEMVALSVTNGWLVTVGFIYSFDAVADVRYKRHVGPLDTVSVILGILSGLYIALLYR